MKNLLLIPSVFLLFLSSSISFAASVESQRDFNDLAKSVRHKLKLYKVARIECDSWVLEIPDCLKGVRRLEQATETFEKLSLSKVSISRKNIGVTADDSVYLYYDSTVAEMLEVLRGAEALDRRSLRDEIEQVQRHILKKWKTPKTQLECQTLMVRGLHYAPEVHPAFNPISLPDCLTGFQNLLEVKGVPERVLNGDTIFMSDNSHWVPFESTEFKYILHYEVDRGALEWLRRMVVAKQRFNGYRDQIFENLNLDPSATTLTCGYAGLVEWCFDVLDLMKDIKFDLSQQNIKFLEMGVFEMHCFVRETTKEKHLIISNEYSVQEIEMHLSNCYQKR